LNLENHYTPPNIFLRAIHGVGMVKICSIDVSGCAYGTRSMVYLIEINGEVLGTQSKVTLPRGSAGASKKMGYSEFIGKYTILLRRGYK
jgi:hypothetical protein